MPNSNPIDLEKKLVTNGFIIGKMDSLKVIKNIKKNLEAKLKTIIKSNKTIELENYHKLNLDSEQHYKIQWELSKFFIYKKYHIKVIKEVIHTIKYLIGSDLMIQKKPYIRIARPNCLNDNIGFHKDTMYGQSTFEMSIHTPLVNLNEKSCLKYVPNSHLLNEKKIIINKNTNYIKPLVKKNSYLHKLGFPYNPKRIDITKFKSKNFNIKLGEYVLFTPALIHGQEINKDNNKTRFTFDTRIVNYFSPIKFGKRGPNRNYEKLNGSSITLLSKNYYNNQK